MIQYTRLCCEFLLKYIVYSLYITKKLGCKLSAADDIMAAGFHWCPPLALFEAFEAVTDFYKLCQDRLEHHIVNIIREQHVLGHLEKSTYDYHKYILAKQ